MSCVFLYPSSVVYLIAAVNILMQNLIYVLKDIEKSKLSTLFGLNFVSPDILLVYLNSEKFWSMWLIAQKKSVVSSEPIGTINSDKYYSEMIEINRGSDEKWLKLVKCLFCYDRGVEEDDRWTLLFIMIYPHTQWTCAFELLPVLINWKGIS